MGGKVKVFVFLTSFLEVEGWYPPVHCPPAIFPFRKIDFGGLLPEDGHPGVRLPELAPKSTRFDYHFFVGVVLWARLGGFVILVEHSGV